jgi:hypothetical protein
MLAQLEAQAAQLQAIYERAQQELQEQWEGYRGLYEKACNMQQVRCLLRTAGCALTLPSSIRGLRRPAASIISS